MKNKYYTFNLTKRTEGILLLLDLEEISREEAISKISKILEDYKYIFRGKITSQYLKVIEGLKRRGLSIS